jgi:hypothetical protein
MTSRALTRVATLAALAEIPLSFRAHAQATPSNLKVDGAPPITAATLERTLPYENTRSAELLDFSARGRSILIATRFGDVAQVHEVAGPGLDRKQLTFYREPILEAAVDPKRDDGFYYAMDTGSRPDADRGDRWFLRRLHGARGAHALQRSAALRRGHRRHLELRELSRAH